MTQEFSKGSFDCHYPALGPWAAACAGVQSCSVMHASTARPGGTCGAATAPAGDQPSARCPRTWWQVGNHATVWIALVVLVSSFVLEGTSPNRAVAAGEPSLTISTPAIIGRSVTVNGVTLPGRQGATIAVIRWDWGDGVVEEASFPASHVYASNGVYQVHVTSVQNDTASAERRLTVTVTGVAAARIVLPMLACSNCGPPPPRFIYLGLPVDIAHIGQIGQPAFNDTRVRDALWATTDPAAVSTSLAGLVDTLGTATSPIVPGSPGRTLGQHSPDVPQCKALLDASGYPPHPEARIVLPLHVPPQQPLLSNVASEIVQEWRKCGVVAEPRFDTAVEYRRALDAGREPFLAILNSVPNEPFALLQALFGRSSSDNFTGPVLDQAEIDTMLQAAARASGAEQVRLYRELEALVMDYLHAQVLPLAWVR